MKPTSKYLIVIAGPTAVGKTALAITLAQQFHAEIISADSRQVYEKLNIGTAKPSRKELTTIPHHFIGHQKVDAIYNVGCYEKEVISFLHQYYDKHDIAILSGGTGLYIDAICHGLNEFPEISESSHTKAMDLLAQGKEVLQSTLQEVDPAYYQKVDIENLRRITRALEVYFETGIPYSQFITEEKIKIERNFNIIKIGLEIEREELYEKINQRVDLMIQQGLMEEVRGLIEYKDLKALDTVGYKELFSYFANEIRLEEAISKIKQHSRNYAKRQMTWFKKDDSYQWFNPANQEAIINFINKKLNV